MLKKLFDLALAFWAGGVTNVLVWSYSLDGKLTEDVVYNTAIWPWHVLKFLFS